MRKNLSIWMLGIAAVLASCSSEDALQGTNDNDGLVRITVQMEDGMKTRATQEEDGESANVTRFVLNAYETTEGGTIQQKATDVVITPLGSGSFTAKLDRKKYYRFICWADEGESSSYTIADDDLTSIALKQNTDGTGYMLPTIAHRGKSDVVYGETAGDVTIQLKHAVAKVMLQTTGALEEGRAKLETKTCTSYNAVTGTGEYDYDTKATVSESGPDAAVSGTDNTPATVLQFYVLTGRTTEDATLTYTDDAGTEYPKNLNSVSFENDYRTIFVGDIAGLKWNTTSITTTLDDNWDDDIELQLPEATANATTHTITTNYAGQIAAMPGLIAEAVGTGSELNIVGPMNADDFAALRAYITEHTDANLSLDLTGMTEMTEIPEYAFFGSKGLSEVKLSDEITRIGSNAFSDCDNLAKINIPQKLESMGVAAFRYIALNEPIELPEGFTTLDTNGEGRRGSQFSSSKITAVTLPASIGEITKEKAISFDIMRELTTVTFKSVVKELHEYAFYWCDKLTDIYMLGNTDSAPEFPTEETAFTKVEPTNVTIHVPQNASSYFSEWVEKGFKVVEVTE